MSDNVPARFRSLDFLGFPKYEVGDDGSVWSLHGRGRRRLKPADHSGYQWVVLSQDRVKREIAVHHLVLLAFVGPCPEGMQCRHDNGIRHDNRLSNLLWGTPAQNAADRVRHGTAGVGEKHGMASLSEADVLAIRAAFVGGEDKASIARRYKVSHATISDITKGRTWRHLGECDQKAHQQNAHRGQRHYRTKLKDEDIRSIRAAARGGESRSVIAARFGIRPALVGKITRRERWRHVTD